MQKQTINEIIERIEKQQTFEATADDGSFEIKINRYVPYCCMAIHDGGNLRSELKRKIALDEYSMWYEEDPHTGAFISSLPITIVGLDSRFEYDLNRKPEDCIYKEAWGKEVWKKALTTKEKQVSLQKHTNFYRVVAALISKLEQLYDGCVVYDIHSYNHERWEREVPLFNIGIENVNQKRFSASISNWKENLAAISLTGIDNKTAINDVFFGRGYNLEFITTNYSKTLVLATEVKKVYCNELTGEDYPKVIKELQQKMKRAILNNALFFSRKNSDWESKLAVNLLDKKIGPALVNIDKKLYGLLKGFELLAYVNPTNTKAEFRRLEKNKFNSEPKFKYAPIKISPFQLKQQLSTLKTREIADISIRHLYESVINSYFDKIDLLASLNSRKFLYNSLRYFGRPDNKDLQNANYLIFLPPIPAEPTRVPYLQLEDTVDSFKRGLDDYNIDCKIELSNKVISQVMVLNSKKTILIRPDAKFTRKEVNALIEHEIGVHMVTTQNSSMQALKIFNLGLPVNTLTQEGLAILSEYLSGNITLKRLKKIAFRVVITDMMCSGADFIECFSFLVHQHNLPHDDAYTIVARIFRGGGFTKDYLYLSGFVEILKMWNADIELTPLLVGKTSMDFYQTICEMIEREMIDKPKFVTKSFDDPKNGNNAIYDYIISGLK